MTAEFNPLIFRPAFPTPARARVDDGVVRKPAGRWPRPGQVPREDHGWHLALKRQRVGDGKKVLFGTMPALPLELRDAIKLTLPPPVERATRAVGTPDTGPAERGDPTPPITVGEFKRVIEMPVAQSADCLEVVPPV